MVYLFLVSLANVNELLTQKAKRRPTSKRPRMVGTNFGNINGAAERTVKFLGADRVSLVERFLSGCFGAQSG